MARAMGEKSPEPESVALKQRPAADTDNDVSGKGTWLQARYLVVFAAFLMGAVNFVMRVNLSVAIVAMTFGDGVNSTTAGSQNVPQYDWDAKTRSTILSSFFWGFVVTQVPSGYLAQRYGPKNLLLISIFISTAVSFAFVPTAALGWEYLCGLRVILGLAQGAMMPCTHTLLARWAPPDERGRMSVCTYSGHLFGTVVAMSGSGLLASTSAGWPVIFYASGSLGLVSSIVWLWLAADTPAQHHYASPRECHYIESSINATSGSQQHDPKQRLRTPWRAMLTSTPMWALIVTHSVQAYGFWTLLTEIPSYMSGVFNFDLAKNGLLSSLPFLVMWVAGLMFSWASDLMLKKGVWSIAISRKVANSIGQYGSAVALVSLAYLSANATAAVVLLTVAVGINAGGMVGYQVNHMDLSPNFAGTMMGITNCTANFMSILGPLVAGFIVTENDNAAQWRVVFLIAAGLYVVGNTTFVIFGSGEVQPWNDPEWMKRVKTEDDENIENI